MATFEPFTFGTLRNFDAPGLDRCLVREERDGSFFLVQLKVKPEFRNKGVGAFMLRTLKSYGRKIRLICCPDDVERWRDLERFYIRHGFTVSGSEMVWNPVDSCRVPGEALDL